MLAVAAFLGSPDARGEKRVVVAPGVGVLKAMSEDMPGFIPAWVADHDGFSGSVRFLEELTAEEVDALEQMGVEFSRASGDAGPDHVGGIYPVRVAWSALDGLVAFKKTVAVESEYLVPPLRPLNITKPMTGAVELSGHVAKNLGALPGAGVRIGDIDSGIDVFHPAFFFADGGYYSWLDVDADGKLTFGTDAVDLDGNGVPGAGEVLALLDVSLVNLETMQSSQDLEPDGIFEPDLDWVYVDTNGNGKRDYGPDAGYTDQTPAFGEPIFLIDDVNGNAAADPEEKLVRLDSPKIKKALVKGKEYTAGKNLSLLGLDVFSADSYSAPAGMHGTGVAGILAGNTPGLSRFVGMAPYADLYMIDSAGSPVPGVVDGTLPKLIWARDQGVQILLFEFSSWGVTFMDGTSNLETAMDQLFQTNGIVQVAPAGNLADSGKHMSTTLSPGETVLGVTLPKTLPGYDLYPFETPAYVLSFYWKGKAEALDLEVALPEGGGYTAIPVQAFEPIALGKNMAAASSAQVSAAGFAHRMCYVWDLGEKKVVTGKWSWKIKNKTGDKLPVHGYLMDYVSSWSRAIEFDKWESTDTTICHPSTANSALSVAAYGGEFGPVEELGKVRPYSSRGPRMDGVNGIDIAAPDDPYTPLAKLYTGIMMGNLEIDAGYTVFGGTSGAGPHVAGALALLKQARPQYSAQQLFDSIVVGALTEPGMGALPNKDWGYGKLQVYKAAFGQVAPVNHPPEAAAQLAWRKGLDVKLDGSASSDADGDALEFQWDIDYDGFADTQWSPSPSFEMSFAEPSTVVAKLWVRDAAGLTDSVLLAFQVADDWVEPESLPDLGPSDSDVTQDDFSSSTDDDSAPPRRRSGCSAGPASASPWWLLLAALGLSLGRTARRRPAE